MIYENNTFSGGRVSNRIWELTSRYATNAVPTYTTLCTRVIGTNIIGTNVFITRQYDQTDDDAHNKHLPAAFDYLLCPVSNGAAVVTPDYVPYGTNGNWWTDIGFGTNVWVYPSSEIVVSNARVTQAYTIKSNDLNNLRTAHNAVTQSVMVKYTPY